MRKIGVFGGTFNPVHNEHINLIKSAIEELDLDELLVVPTNIPPHKETSLISVADRVNMLNIAISGIKKARICDIELKREGKSYTYLTVEELKKQYPKDQLYLIVGGDMLSDFKYWKEPNRILNCVNLVAAGRFGEKELKSERVDFVKTFNKDFISLKFCGEEVSSTRIRIYAGLGLSLQRVVPAEIEEYIKDHSLYSDKYFDFVRENLPEKRRIHTSGVMLSALQKVKETNLNPERVRISALLHDCAKYLNPEDYKDFKLDTDVPKPVVHAFLGAFVAEKVLGITDKEIIEAIKYHTSGKADMTDLQKLIFTADMVEENRVYEGVEVLRAKFNESLEDGFLLCLKEEMVHLVNKGGKIYKETMNAFNYYIKGEQK